MKKTTTYDPRFAQPFMVKELNIGGAQIQIWHDPVVRPFADRAIVFQVLTLYPQQRGKWRKEIVVSDEAFCFMSGSPTIWHTIGMFGMKTDK